ncbi:MAG TPA: hypothetical protein VNN20_06510 [Thermodesulfobacteriota bacterium]|nr:hypothetical protein [Thermodesulfobacteriota bacterium]
MKDIHIRLGERGFNHINQEAGKRGISIAEYIRLLIESNMEDGNRNIKIKSLLKLYLLKLPLKECEKLLREIIRKKKRVGPLESYVEGILENKPDMRVNEICTVLSNKFDTKIRPNVRTMVRRMRKRFHKRRERMINKTNDKGIKG